MPLFWERAASGDENGPSITFLISSCADICSRFITRAGSLTPGSCTKISCSASARPCCWMTGSVSPKPLMRFSIVDIDCWSVSALRRSSSLGRTPRANELPPVELASQDGASSSRIARTSLTRSVGVPSS